MANYVFLHQQNPTPSDVLPFYEPGFFFNEYAHLRQQAENFILLSAVNQETQQTEARCAFFIQADEACSPAAAPFGSIEFSETLPDAVLDKFLFELTAAARNEGVKKLRIVSYPHCYAQQQAARLMNRLSAHNFVQQSAHPTYYLPIGRHSFDDRIVPAECRRLQRCRRTGLQFNQWASTDVAEVVDFIQETRQQKGYPMAVSSRRVTKLCQQFPDQFVAFAVTDGPRLAAVTITVRVRHDILYNFLPASHPDYQTLSPMVMLIDGLFDYCKKTAIRLLDLGVSLDANKQPKPGLIRFKRNLGAQESPKQVFEKIL
ncbi:GNAT family N-acetyltransferase [Spirosoma radiotolerans]|uniref:BioF2-like acetyltransferase domain-containing protein n=1 Tax=Spirosoma radiotolerans TaxID=1379870 RepID=A0A0E3V581_9BACT|nr:GNAT family N-acetyltransferase [Spirosoma radiotolerans]AKD53947.1 hypothetical protein SD10_02530 [Spirosoma radiotolerans]